MMSQNIFLFLLLQSVSSLHISINGDKGNDFPDCLKGEFPCQSMMYVADSFRLTSNLTITIISSTLSLQGSVVFTGINGLTINGKGTNIKCNGTGINGSGIVFNNCSNVKLNNFTVEYCGLLHKQNKYCGQQAILVYNCSNFVLLQVNLNYSNGTGLVMYNIEGIVGIWQCVFSNSKLMLKDGDILYRRKFLTVTCFGGVIGGGLHVIRQLRGYKFFMERCQFINNSASSTGGALYLTFNDYSLTVISIMSSSFIGNTADTSGGAIGITVQRHGEISVYSQYSINFRHCNIIGNAAQFGGGVALEITHKNSRRSIIKTPTNDIRFHWCKFIDNKAKVSSAVDINGNNQKLYQSLHTIITFQQNCQFRGNVAGIDLPHTHQHYKGKYFKATVFAIDVLVDFSNKVSFYNNTGTPLYLKNTRVHFGFRSNASFINNTGDQGGAILVDENAVIDLYSDAKLNFLNNTAVIGGAIFIQSLVIMQYKGTCFLQNKNITADLNFMNNKAWSKIGNDIFASTFQPCVQLYDSNVTALFTNGKMGTFNFSSSIQHAVSTAPAMIILNETHLFPYPGLPYTMNITLLDELNNNVTNLQLFPLSASLLHKTSVSIDLAHFIANNYTIIFKGQVGDNDTLLLQTTEYSALLHINVTLYQCPPGYIIHKNSCHCSHSAGNVYYYGILRCLEDYHAVIAAGLWAGYIKEEFITADCATSLCTYHEENFEEHVLPLNYSLLNDYVCASHRTGVLCGTCNTGYTTYLHSPNYQCGESTHCQYGPLLYVISEIIPVTGLFLVILFFNINLTSGAMYSFIFYSQIISNYYTLHQSNNDLSKYFFNAVKIVYGIFDLSIMEIDALSFCLFKNATIMDLMLIKYLTTLYALFLIIVTILILRFNSLYFCIKLFHKCGRRNIRGSVINALTAFLVLCYFQCLVITLHILVPSYLMGMGGKTQTVPLYSGDLFYMSNDHLKYVIPAIICLIIVILPPPIILLLEPLLIRVSGVLNIRRNVVTYTLHKLRMKLKPFLDSFQGCFKDNYRCFAGLFFIYRILLVLIPIYWSEGTFWNIVTKQTLLFLILLLHSICAPFQKKIFNHLNSSVLVNLLMINMLQLELLIKYNSTVTFMVVFQLVLMFLPLIYLLGYIGQHFRRYYVQKKLLESIDSNVKDDEFPARLVPELMKSYNTFEQ